MRNQGQFTLGVVVVVVGVVLLIANLLHIDLGLFCWPLAFILLGLFFILRPRMIEPGTAVTQKHFYFHPKTLVFPPQNTSVFLKKTSDFCKNTSVFFRNTCVFGW